MALIKCKECGNEVSSKAEACPKCGYSVASNQWTTFRKIKYGLVIVLIILLNKTCSKDEIRQSPLSSNPVPSPSDLKVELPLVSPTPIPTPIIGAQWSYRQEDDEMGKGQSNFARVISLNTVNFGFPYSGEQHASLLIRSHPRHGKNILFSIEKGQILCSSYSGCSVLVRFDDEDAKRYSANETADNSTETVFISNYDKFIGKLQKAKRVKISVDVYQQGSPVFEFDVSGFDASKYRPK